MNKENVIAINGVHYDAMSGQVIEATTTVEQTLRRDQSMHARGIHNKAQKSATLNRQFVKKSVAQTAPVQPARTRASMDVKRVRPARSPHISKFATVAQTANAPIANTAATRDVPATVHPVVAQALQKSQTQAVPAAIKHVAPATAQETKQLAMTQALESAKTNHDDHKTPNHKSRTMSIVGASIAMLLVAGYLTYMNMPALSVKVASAQANIAASFPDYQPNGFRLSGPVAYTTNEVILKFVSNSGPQNFALSQVNSAWDSSALLEKYVLPKSDGKYVTYTDGGLTIYTFGNNAAWVNGGILYTINGTASLSNDQIRRMATSMR